MAFHTTYGSNVAESAQLEEFFSDTDNMLRAFDPTRATSPHLSIDSDSELKTEVEKLARTLATTNRICLLNDSQRPAKPNLLTELVEKVCECEKRACEASIFLLGVWFAKAYLESAKVAAGARKLEELKRQHKKEKQGLEELITECADSTAREMVMLGLKTDNKALKARNEVLEALVKKFQGVEVGEEGKVERPAKEAITATSSPNKANKESESKDGKDKAKK